MSSIKILGVNATSLLKNTKLALEKFQGSPLKGDTKVRQFLKDFFNLPNEHMLHTVFANPSLDDAENTQFQVVVKKLWFLVNPENQSVKLQSVEVEYDVVGYYAGKVKIFESILHDGVVKNPRPTFTDTYSGFRYDPKYQHVSSEDATDNLQAAINHAFDLCKRIAETKTSRSIEQFQADGWTIQSCIEKNT